MPWRRLGRLAVLAWCVGNLLLLFTGLLGESGAFGWTAGWQHRLFRTDDPVAATLRGMAVLVVPLFVVELLLPRPAGHPFVAGLEDGVGLLARPPFLVQPLDPRRALLRRAWVLLGWALASGFVALVCGMTVPYSAEYHRGDPLPVLDLAAVVARRAALPPYARVSGAVAQDGAAQERDRWNRSGHFHDTYTPLVGPSWRPGDPVEVVLKDSVHVGFLGTRAPPPAKLEGEIGRAPVPDDVVLAMRRDGLRVPDGPVVLARERLDGIMPGPNHEYGLTLMLAFGGPAFWCLLVSVATFRERRRCPAGRVAPERDRSRTRRPRR